MNKLLIFPISFMFVLTIFSSVYSNVYHNATSGDYGEQTGTQIQGETGNVTVPNAGSQSFNIWDEGLGYAMVILIAAMAVGTVAGVHILGSGLSESSQMMIFNAIFFLSLWACLTVISSNYLFDNVIPTILWISLTLIFVIGLALHLNNSGD